MFLGEFVLYKIVLLFVIVFMMACGRAPVAEDGGAVSGIRIVSLAPNITEAIFAVGAGAGIFLLIFWAVVKIAPAESG